MSIEQLPSIRHARVGKQIAFGAAAFSAAAALAISLADSIGAYTAVGIGGAIGGMARYWCSGVVARLIGETFPFGTLIINIVGSFVIGFFGTLTGPNGRIFVGAAGANMLRQLGDGSVALDGGQSHLRLEGR
jgi:hypothetical protein